jgi:diguanylate cyclase (GGDEF)-like protein/PAS domain S-box-containing protein
LNGQAFLEQPVTYLDAQQRDRQVAMRSFPLRDETGNIQYAVVLTRCLDAQQSGVHETAHARHTSLQQLADSLPSLVAHLDSQERHTYANRAYLKTFNQTADSIAGQSLLAVVGPVVYQQLRDSFQQALQGSTVDICLPMIESDKTIRHKWVSLIPHPQGQAAVGVYMVLKEIVAHQRVTNVVKHDTDFFRQALEGAKVGTWEWNLVKGELLWSRNQEILFGLAPGTFDGCPDTFLALVDERDRAVVQAAIERALQPQHHFSAEFRIFEHPSGVRWLSQRGQVLRDDAGQAVRMVGIAFDITRQKATEEKLLQQVKQEHLIAQISQAISHSHNLDEVLPAVATRVRDYLAVDRIVIIDLRNKMAGEVKYESHHPDVESMLTWKMRHPWAVKSAFLEKYNQGHPVAVSNIHEQALSEAEVAFLKFFQIAADLTMPLREDETLWGLLSAHSTQPRVWQSADCRLLETLGTLVSTAIQRDRLHRNLTRANQKLKRFAYLDGLTQVANRRRFEQFISYEWRRLMREQSPMALIMADIDHFKAYNDMYGHQSGDECLRQVAGTLRAAIQRPADMVARYGGEEFAVVLPNTNLEGAETVAQKMRLMVKNQRILHRGSPCSQYVTMSMGIAVLFPHPLKSPDQLVEAADQALYQAKEEGRDRIVCYVPSPLP